MELKYFLAVIMLAVSVLVLNFQMFRVLRRLYRCEDRIGAIDILADQVSDLSDDFYGPSYK